MRPYRPELPSFSSFAVLVVFIASVLVPSSAAAQDDAGARLHFEAGARDFSAGRYESALQSFRASYDLSQRPGLLYNISLCEQELGHTAEAAASLRRFLEEVEEVPSRDVLEARLVRLEAEAARQAEARAEAERAEGEARAQAEESGGEGVSESRGRPVPTGAWVSYGIGGAGLVTGVSLGITGLSRKRGFESGCGVTASCSRDEVRRMERLGIGADVAFAITIAAAATGVVLHLVLREDEEDAAGATTAAPFIAPNVGGIAVVGSF